MGLPFGIAIETIKGNLGGSVGGYLAYQGIIAPGQQFPGGGQLADKGGKGLDNVV